MPESKKARVVGFNHIAIEVGDIEEALAFYGRLFDFQLRSKSDTMAFIDLGDQFLALQKGRTQPPDDGRQFESPMPGRNKAPSVSIIWPLMSASKSFGLLRFACSTSFAPVRHHGLHRSR